MLSSLYPSTLYWYSRKGWCSFPLYVNQVVEKTGFLAIRLHLYVVLGSSSRLGEAKTGFLYTGRCESAAGSLALRARSTIVLEKVEVSFEHGLNVPILAI
jgi:hypothetical protein